MANTGNVFPTAAVNVDRAGNTAWTSPGNVVSDNGTDASVAVPSDYLVTSGYGFAIPADAVILGVTVRVEATETGSGNSNYIPQLHSDTTPTLIGSAKGSVTVTGTTPTVSSNGGTTDLWGATLTPAIVNSAGFGVTLWSTDTGNTLSVDYVTIAIEWAAITTGCMPQQVKKRRSLTRRLIETPAPEIAYVPADDEPSASISLGEPFVTRRQRGRKIRNADWSASLAPVQQAQVVPCSAWMAPATRKRRETARKLIEVEPLQWQYIAPTVAAILAPYRPKVVRFERKVQLPLALEVYPPSTGPPASENTTLAEPFTTRKQRSRRLLEVRFAPVYPEPSAPPAEVAIAALVARRVQRRKSRQGLFLGGGGADVYAAAVTPAVYPSFVPNGFHKRKDTHRKLIRLAQPSYPQTPAVSAQPVTAWTGRKAIRRNETERERQKVVHSTFPQTPAVVVPYVPAAKALRRRDTERTRVKVAIAPVYPVAAPPPAWATKPVKRTGQTRTLQTVAPVIARYEVVYAALVLETVYRRRQKPRKVWLPQTLEWVEAAEPTDPGLCGDRLLVVPRRDGVVRVPECNGVVRAAVRQAIAKVMRDL